MPQFQSLCCYKPEQLLVRQGCSCESIWSRDKLVHLYVCQVPNCALKLFSKHIKQWGRVCILCKGCRAGRPGSLASACLGCSGNCLSNHLPNVVMSCWSLHCSKKPKCEWQFWCCVCAGQLRETLKDRTRLWPRKPLTWSVGWMPTHSSTCCTEEETARGLELVCSPTSTKTQHKYRRIRNHHDSDQSSTNQECLIHR